MDLSSPRLSRPLTAVRTAVAVALLVAAAAAATAAAAPDTPAPAQEPAAERPAAAVVPRDEILRLTPEMEAFLDANVAGASAELRVGSLLDALFQRGRLDVAYSNVRTTTAAETFELRSGNCLSFTLMVAAMARHLGLEVRFREVGEVLSWSQRGDVLLNSKHLFAEVPAGRDVVAIDFLPGSDKRYRRPRLVGEERVIAHFYSNLGAESLAAGEPQRALAELRQAIATDPTFGWAWTNLGVVYRQLGRPEEAEAAYLEGHRLDPSDVTPLSNLAALYDAQGKERKAARLERRVEKHRRRSPFFHYRLSLQASAAGRPQEAIAHMRRAVRRGPEDPALRARLAELYHADGRHRKAEQSLELALHYAGEPELRERLERLLAEWRADGD